MTSRKPRKETNEALDIEVVALEASEVNEEKPEIMSLEAYVARAKPRAGLVASFTYEAEKSENGLKERSEAEWKADFEAQAKRVYSPFQ